MSARNDKQLIHGAVRIKTIIVLNYQYFTCDSPDKGQELERI